MRPAALTLFAASLALTIAACGGSDAPEPVDAPPAEDVAPSEDEARSATAEAMLAQQDVERATGVAETEEAGGITMAKFNQLETGMSYAEVVEILGEEGTELSRTDMMGIVTVMYSWDGKSFASNMNAMFQNDEMVSKAQLGLE